MNNYLKTELRGLEARILKFRDAEDGNTELRATLNNILTPVLCILDEIDHCPVVDTEDMAIIVLQETRIRMDELFGPETLPSGREPIPRAKDTIPCDMKFDD